MFVPILDDEEEEELHHQQPQREFRPAFGTMMARVVKINNIVLLLSLGVATFCQYSTLEPEYVNALMWAKQASQDGASLLSTQSMILRTLQSFLSVLLLTFLRTVVFARQHQDEASTFHAVLSDLLFHIQCRLVIGFLACFTTPWIPFDLMETAVVCISLSTQITKLAVLQ
ncbi:expressed unknown protein [Seminavis robusta]|uniref:Transmembrane protein n=1 Tax=Seminavis robusta TaxID=568900 RepID=A0A9N8E6E8_9STRA|nr:expressed unknown protein [Seminavis robusta]|eukprot:Sro671_g184770.1 n/a (171) ;mRNA; f:1632-2144